MRLTITDRLVARTATDGQAVPFTVNCYTDTSEPWALVVPTTLRYRIDSGDGCNIVAWTTLTPASATTVTITGAQGTVSYGYGEKVRRQLIVEADHGLSTNCVAVREYWIRNLIGVYA